MATLNEIKEQIVVVKSVGEFTNALQQIATLHMMKLRERVLASRPFVETAHSMLQEIVAIRANMHMEDMAKVRHTAVPEGKRAVIVITSNQGLTGRYNIEIYQKIEKILEAEASSDFYVVGKKGQEYFAGGKFKVQHFPYSVPENFTIADLERLTNIFDLYSHVLLVYSRYINTATHEVVTLSVVSPVPEGAETDKPLPRYLFEPDIDALITGISKKLRAALFQQQILDGRLAQYASQMIGMKTASDNATNLVGDLMVDYNKQRRKMIDKKISEVFAGSALW